MAPGRRAHSASRPGDPYFVAGASTEIITAAVQVMSTLSPTFTFSIAFLSATRELYFQPFGPLNVMDSTLGSRAVMVAVIVRCVAAVPPGLAPFLSGGVAATFHPRVGP